MHQVFNYLVKDEANTQLIDFLDILFVLTHSKFFEFLRIFDDLIYSLQLFVLLDIRLILVETICHELVNMVIISQMYSCLIQDIGLHVIRSFFWRNSHFREAKTRNKTVFLQDFVLVDFISGVERFA